MEKIKLKITNEFVINNSIVNLDTEKRAYYAAADQNTEM